MRPGYPVERLHRHGYASEKYARVGGTGHGSKCDASLREPERRSLGANAPPRRSAANAAEGGLRWGWVGGWVGFKPEPEALATAS